MYLISNLKLHLLLHSEAENSRPVSGVVNFILSEYDRSVTVRLERVGELGGVDGLVLNTPGEDDGGQPVGQLAPEK